MATLKQKVEAEATMRELLADNGVPEPDEVEYGFACIRLFWHDTKTVVVIDIDEPLHPAGDDGRPLDPDSN